MLEGEIRDEFKHKERGELSLTFSFSRFHSSHQQDLFQIGDPLAIIDCMTFVPEYIPVLRALELQQLSTLPFQSGALLNLSSTLPQLPRSLSEFPASSFEQMIRFMIQTSPLEPLAKIRMNHEVTGAVVARLTSLVTHATLDAEQLESFLSSFLHSVHLTQGPPGMCNSTFFRIIFLHLLMSPSGTGKSYLGVVIVRALLIIRQYWIKICPEVGNPPILVLSYKNHAIDEFLVDLARVERRLDMIRIGGSVKDMRLQRYAECNQRFYQDETQKTKQLLQQLYRQKNEINRVLKRGMSPIDVMQADANDVPKSQQDLDKRDQVEQQAAIHLHNLICRKAMMEYLIDKINNGGRYGEQNDEDEDDDDGEDCIDMTAEWRRMFTSYTDPLPMNGLSKISSLLKGYQHHGKATNSIELLYKWITGQKPFPKCCFEDCTQLVRDEGLTVCRKHRCPMPVFDSTGEICLCNEPVIPNLSWCARHHESSKGKMIDLSENEETKLEGDNEDGWIVQKGSRLPPKNSGVSEGIRSERNGGSELNESDGASMKSIKDDEDVTSTKSDLSRKDSTISEEALPDEDTEKQPLDNPDEFEEPENVAHLRDVFDVEELRQEFERDEDDLSDFQDVESEGDIAMLPTLIPTELWSWDMTLEERWSQCAVLEESFRSVLMQWYELFKQRLDVARKRHHEATVRANTRVYEDKALIGGTMVGCITRLEAIRRCNPFAILVEEASEVLEPLLFACFGPSTLKLEMIGDHLQLMPNIMQKFQFQLNNNVNVSMFERLIAASSDHQVPSNTLATQRRMRPNIADLTRPYYTEIVKIKDDPICLSKKIKGSRENSSNSRTCGKISDCPSKGREIPGVQSHIYFWTHTGRQTKAAVGLSRVNITEAEMTTSLAKYLVECGVPKTSIAILTPYKGQLMLMRNKLISDGLLSSYNSNSDDDCILSTVDRFQGDEADVVIISLVIDGESRTPFLELRNRFIVLASRARIGMYIIGNVAYFEGKISGRGDNSKIQHWIETFQRLAEPGNQDTNPDSVEEDVQSLMYLKSRIGPELPLCCPLHRKSHLEASSSLQLKLNFCKHVCDHVLQCSHQCGLNCHFSSLNFHNPKCQIKLLSPCKEHPSILHCYKVYKNYSKFHCSTPGTIDTVLPLYKCEVMVSLSLPCSHEITVTCAEASEMNSGNKSHPKCEEPALSPMVYSDCRHSINVKCWEYYQYINKPETVPPCKAKVTYIPPSCGHEFSTSCYHKRQYEKGTRKFICPKRMQVQLPRCGHNYQASCEEKIRLEKWSGQSCSNGFVMEGGSYGPKDSVCHVEVTFVKECKHEQKMTCEAAFDLASQTVTCHELVRVINPACGHPAEIACHSYNTLKNRPEMVRTSDPIQQVNEGESSKIFQRALFAYTCKTPLTFTRKCGHSFKTSCSEAKSGHFPPCGVQVEIENPLCGHPSSLPCHLIVDVQGWEPWPNHKDLHKSLKDSKRVFEDKCPFPQPFPPTLEKHLNNCQENLSVVRSATCNHESKMKCCRVFKKVCAGELPLCKELVEDAPLICGHKKAFKCFELDIYNGDPTAYKCPEKVEILCCNFVTCGSVQETECFTKDKKKFVCERLQSWKCNLDSSHSHELPLCKIGLPDNCPDCYIDELQKSLNQEDLTTEELLLNYPIPVELSGLISNVTVSPEALELFSSAQRKVADAFVNWASSQHPFKRPMHIPQYVRCFVRADEKAERFNSKNLIDKKYCGAKVYQFNERNLKEVFDKINTSIFILVGIAFICNPLHNPTDVPNSDNNNSNQRGKKSKGKKSLTSAEWLQKGKKSGHDCVITSNSRSDMIYIWSPYPIIATHKIKISKMDMNNIIWSGHYQIQLPRTINFSYVDGSSPIEFSKIPFTEPKRLPKVNGIKLPLDWDSKSLARIAVLDENLQQELRTKLQFCASSISSTE